MGNATGVIWAGPLDPWRDAGACPQGVMLLPWETRIAFPTFTPCQPGGIESRKPLGVFAGRSNASNRVSTSNHRSCQLFLTGVITC